MRHAVPDGEEFGHEYVQVARRLEHTLALIKGRLYGEAHAVHLEWHELWETARAELDQHNWIERRMVDLLIKHGDPVELDGLANACSRRRPAARHGRIRSTPHTGIFGLVARRIWALADRFWDAAEGRVIPDPVRPAPHRHDSLISQYLVADPKFDSDATIMDHHHRRTAGRPGSAALARRVNDGLRPRPA